MVPLMYNGLFSTRNEPHMYNCFSSTRMKTSGQVLRWIPTPLLILKRRKSKNYWSDVDDVHIRAVLNVFFTNAQDGCNVLGGSVNRPVGTDQSFPSLADRWLQIVLGSMRVLADRKC